MTAQRPEKAADGETHAAQDHFRTLRLASPFQPRIDALMRTEEWYDWAGYKAPHSLWDEELEYFAIRSQAALFDISPMVKYRIEGPDAEAFLNRVTLRDVSKLKPGRVHYTAWCDDEGHVLDDGTLFRLTKNRVSACAARSGICPGCSTARIGFDVISSRRRPKPSPVWRCRDRRHSRCCAMRASPASRQLKIFDLAEFPHDGGNGHDLAHRLHRRSRLRTVRTGRNWRSRLWDRLFEAGRTPRHPRHRLHRAQPRAHRGRADRRQCRFRHRRARHPRGPAAHAGRDRPRLHDRSGKGPLQRPPRHPRRRAPRRTLQHVLVGLEIEGNIPAEHAIVYHQGKREVGLVSAAIWSPMAKRNIAIASLERPFGDTVTDDLWVEIYAMRELQYQKLMKRAKVVPRPFIKLDRRTANPPADF